MEQIYDKIMHNYDEWQNTKKQRVYDDVVDLMNKEELDRWMNR